MRIGIKAPKFLLGDHLGSTSVIVNGNGAQGYILPISC
jgi:hypothetical protein